MQSDPIERRRGAVPGALDGVRVLDLTDLPGALVGRLLGDLGADVVHVEPPGGAGLRRVRGAHDYYSSNKRSLVIDVATPAGADELGALLARADVLVDASPPDLLAAAGIARAGLAAHQPRLIHVAVTPFGLDGPRAHWKGSDLVCAAAGGMVFVNGHPGSAPLAPFGLAAYASAGLFGAIGALCALRSRQRTGRGATVDVSIAAAVAGAVEHVTGFHRQTGSVEPRRGTLHWSRSFRIGPCRDGALLHCILGDWTSLVEWVTSASDAPELRDPRWDDPEIRRAECERIFDVLDRWSSPESAAEIAGTAQLLRLPFARVREAHDLGSDPHLAARGFAIPAAAGRGRDGRLLPGAPFRMTATPWRLRRAAPGPGEHTDEVRSDPAWRRGPEGTHAGIAAHGTPDATGIATGDGAGAVPFAARDRSAPRPLDGITVLDFTWVVAGPVATRILADQGARVIKVERKNATDFGSRRGGLTGNLNRGKHSIVLDLAQSRGIELARRLAAESDIVIDNFSARVMPNLGLDHENLRASRPDVITVRMSGFGLDGPHRDHVSYGPTLQAMTGYPLLMRHPGGPIAGWGYSWSDMAGGIMAALATLAALRHRDRTGEGQEIDLGQFENLVALMGPALLDLLRGRAVDPPGNGSQEGATVPHGIWRCAPEPAPDGGIDDDRWVAIAVLDDESWRALARVLIEDREEWAGDAGFATLAGRLDRGEEIARGLERWARTRSAAEVADRLQRAGVAASLVANGADLARDPALLHRGFFETVADGDGRGWTFDGVPFRSSGQAGFVVAPGPLLGEHTDAVLGDVLGLGGDELAALRREGVIA